MAQIPTARGTIDIQDATIDEMVAYRDSVSKEHETGLRLWYATDSVIRISREFERRLEVSINADH